VADDGAARGGAPTRKTASNRVYATYSSEDSIAFTNLDAKQPIKVPAHFSCSPPELAAKFLRKYLLVYPKPQQMKEFPGLLYQTRQPAECSGGKGRGKTGAERR
jgi:hypothetical protein